MNCQRVRSLLSTYLDEMLPARDAGSVAGHLARCEGCRRELQALETAIVALDRVRPVTPPIDLWARLQERIATQHSGVPGRAAPRESNALLPRLNLPAPAFRALRLALASLAVAGALLGYRIGIRSDFAREGVLARSLVSVDAGPGVRREEAAEPASAGSRRRGLPIAAITPPEASMAPWHSWGPRDREESSSREETIRRRAEVPVLPPAASAVDAGLAHHGSGEGTENSPGALSSPSSGTPRVASKRGVSRRPDAPVEATPSAHVADALQASIEETARRQVVDEVALLALALTGADTPRKSGNGRGEGGEIE